MDEELIDKDKKTILIVDDEQHIVYFGIQFRKRRL